jgi:hypothetical protein
MKNPSEASPVRLVKLDTLEDLKHVLYVQKTIGQGVRREMIALATTKELATGKVSGPEEMRRIITGQSRLLEKYAKYPTLSEFSFHPSLAMATHWGATFGVAIMVKALIVDQIKATMPVFAPFMRNIYILILKELNNPTHEFLIEPLEESIKFRVTVGEDGEEVDNEKSKMLTRRLLYQATESLLMISVQYQIVEAAPVGFAISEMGRRCLLHLIDADIFLNELAEAHKRFQSERPRLNFL